ncbi:sodium- and chloride-dependent GABA transporter 1-like [Tigriopus californicus]|uniref:sodium- and chloride-dependent GABA transporter 1-like n=1 Tax=Tigriopus californicus TaxID=6832 RepID=UPI0027DAB256|nr:sodium- and chloride-dependent GABA transporter 1-like [Tigriopus californicus]XP_059090207.1 sodium- and chloride-dependent GABA transporter 1-like [Tigriopus californicus]XP_059090208.1 sodium- and chloride-dependent GABA transporter 1-like [Tigriopus californicus]XP_059090209.1 sodium- and chloride-dependent GABA transporter 1-like [Tigriopus californicus]XP_059090210.1 sodium- and chloride-dependent GABA transporter 1-like [Tigriopus californicus]
MTTPGSSTAQTNPAKADNKNTFYFSGKKRKEGTGFEDEDEDENHDDHFIEFKVGQNIPQIILPDGEEAGKGGGGDTEGEDGHERGQWGNKWDFLFSCISVSVGLGNVWRFPYLCYKNGGGAFLLVYFIAMIFCGIPIFFQEVAIGQYLGSGGMTLVAQLCPMLKGVGMATMIVVFFLDIYYCVIIAWTFFYLIASFTAIPDLPWDTCEGWWNTPNCFRASPDNMTFNDIGIANHSKTATNRTTTPVEEFWEHRVLMQNAGLEHGLGGMQWELVGTLFLAWVLVYLIIWKGLHSSGKIIWFTALFPYFVMFILLARAVTLDGAIDGLSYYVKVDWPKLLEGRTWIDGATQIFFAYSVGMGALPALGSYNKFHHDCYKDAIITCIVNTATCLIAGVLVFSILGYMAHIQETTIDDVVNSGPGLVFLTYPDLVLNLPGSVAWAMIFFIMLLVLGVDSEFCNVEALVTGIVDNWPDVLLKRRRLFTMGLCVFMFLLGLPMCTEGGVFLFQLMDFYSASGMSLLWVCFFQTIAIGWFFGAERFCDCVEEMTTHRPSKFWYLCWKYFAPAVMITVFVFYVISYQPVTYGKDYEYPKWAEILGLCLSLSSMSCVPGYALYYLITHPGTFEEKMRDGFTPNINRLKVKTNPQNLHVSESGVGLLQRNNTEYEMGRLHRPESFVTTTTTE